MLDFEEQKRSELQRFYGNRQMKKYSEGGGVEDAITGSTSRQDRRAARQELRANETLGEKVDRQGAQNAIMGTGLGVAGTVVGELDNTPDKYDGADVAGESLKYASMGAALGPWGALAGAAVGAGIGLVKKGKAEKAAIKADKLESVQNELESSSVAKGERSALFAEGGTVDPYKTNSTITQAEEPWYGDNDFLDGISNKINTYRANGERTLDNTQVGLTALGMAPVAGIVPDAINTAISAGRAGYNYATGDVEAAKGHVVDVGINAAMMVPIAGQGVATAKLASKVVNSVDKGRGALNFAMSTDTIQSHFTGGGVSDYLASASKTNGPINQTTFKNGGETKGAYSHSKNPLTVVDKKGKPVGMELTGGEGVFDKPAMNRIKKMAMSGNYAKLGQYVEKEMNTWKHK